MSNTSLSVRAKEKVYWSSWQISPDIFSALISVSLVAVFINLLDIAQEGEEGGERRENQRIFHEILLALTIGRHWLQSACNGSAAEFLCDSFLKSQDIERVGILRDIIYSIYRTYWNWRPHSWELTQQWQQVQVPLVRPGSITTLSWLTSPC